MGDAAAAAARLEELTSLYERHAYLVYNVALRTAVDDAAARRAATRAFLRQVGEAGEEELAADVARLAAEEAPRVDPQAQESPVLAANARLAAPERAALALTELADADVDDLTRRAFTKLGDFLELDSDAAEEAYRDLPWIEPPEELWAEVYSELHVAVTQALRAAAREQQTEVRATPVRKRRHVGDFVGRMSNKIAATMVVLGLLAVAAAASMGGGSSSGQADAAGDYFGGSSVDQDTALLDGGEQGERDPAGDEGSDDYEALTPEQLDNLRKKEIEELKRYSKRQQDESLPRSERRKAADRVDDLVALAQRRQRYAERREANLRRMLAREREARVRERQEKEGQESEQTEPTQTPSNPPQQRRPPQREPQESKEPAEPAPTEEPAETECLYDEGSGTYICPE